MSARVENAGKQPANRGRHDWGCKVCRHAERESIESDWLAKGQPETDELH